MLRRMTGLVTLLTRPLSIPAAGFQFAFEVEQTAFFHVVADNLCGARERGNVVPSVFLDDVAAVVLVLLGLRGWSSRLRTPPLVLRVSSGFRSVSINATRLSPCAIVVSPSWGVVGLRLWPCRPLGEEGWNISSPR